MAAVLECNAEDAADEGQALGELAALMRAHGTRVVNMDPLRLAQCVRLATLSFLRCAVVFGEATGITAPDISLATFDALRTALSLPTVASLFSAVKGSRDVQEVVVAWLAQLRAAITHVQPALELFAPRLVQLPASFSTLALSSREYVCPRMQGPPIAPAMCLVCGTVVCARSTCCQQVVKEGSTASMGACFMHAKVFAAVNTCNHMLSHLEQVWRRAWSVLADEAVGRRCHQPQQRRLPRPTLPGCVRRA